MNLGILCEFGAPQPLAGEQPRGQRKIELLGTQVIPELQKRGSSAVATGLALGIKQAEATAA